MMIGRKCLAVGITGALAVCSMQGVAESRVDRSKFHLGAYCFNEKLADDAHVKEMKDCGLDYLIGVPVTSRKVLDLFHKHGIGAVVGGVVPGWCGGGPDCDRVAQLRPRQGYVDALDKYAKGLDHPAIWMIDLTDEPGRTGFGHFADICGIFKEKCPDVLPYVNLFPNYASPYNKQNPKAISQLCADSYQQYVDHYAETFPLPYISFDHYMMRGNYSKGALKQTSKAYFENLRVISEACRATGRDHWAVVAVNSLWKERRLSANQLRYQAFASMAYGSVSIAWACWCKGWWDYNIYDKDGKRDDIQYAALKTVNHEILRIAGEYMRFRNVGTTVLSNKEGDPKAYSDGWFNGLRATDDSAAVVGAMAPRCPKSLARAVLVFAAADPEDAVNKTRTFEFGAAGRVRAYGARGEVPVAADGQGRKTFSLKDSDAVLLVLE